MLPLLALLLCSCGGATQRVPVQGIEEGKEVALREAVNRFWNCRIAEDYVGVYDLMEPLFRERVAVGDFLKDRGAVRYTKFVIHKIEIQEDRGRVTVLYKWKPKVPGMPEDEQWTRMDDSWRFLNSRWYKVSSEEG